MHVGVGSRLWQVSAFYDFSNLILPCSVIRTYLILLCLQFSAVRYRADCVCGFPVVFRAHNSDEPYLSFVLCKIFPPLFISFKARGVENVLEMPSCPTLPVRSFVGRRIPPLL